ncbi:MAG: hypothetical protein KJ626_16090 [Verrucomicrobia bacterium]|nr:hypothetical protein [Verrucomicrobiota bacterium]
MSNDVCHIALTFDTDNDFFDHSLVQDGQDERALMRWRGVEEGIPILMDLLGSYTGSAGEPSRITWFVRSDGQLATYYDDPAYLLRQHDELWQAALRRGHEIAWHPHLYRFEDGKWMQETEGEKLEEQMTVTLAAIREAGYEPRSSRIGEAYGSNVLMSLLEGFGMQCDSTAMPGRKRVDDERLLDWSRTSPGPYHPSRQDYQVSGEDGFSLLEVPMAMARMKTSYDAEPYLRYVDLSFRHEVMKQGLRDLLQNASLLVTITHPSTILPDIVDSPHGLLSFDVREYRRNLEFVLSELDMQGRPYRFVTIDECRALHGDRRM